jgi:hypothetical protein
VPWDLRRKAAVRRVRPDGVRDSGRAPTAIATTATSCASREMRQSNRIVKQCVALAAREPGP